MIMFIVLFLPAVLSVWIRDTARNAPLSKRKWLCFYALNNLLVNFTCFAVKRWVLSTGGVALMGDAGDMTPAAACNYLIMAVPVSIALGLAELFFAKRVRLQVESDADTTEVTGNEEKR